MNDDIIDFIKSKKGRQKPVIKPKSQLLIRERDASQQYEVKSITTKDAYRSIEDSLVIQDPTGLVKIVNK